MHQYFCYDKRRSPAEIVPAYMSGTTLSSGSTHNGPVTTRLSSLNHVSLRTDLILVIHINGRLVEKEKLRYLSKTSDLKRLRHVVCLPASESKEAIRGVICISTRSIRTLACYWCKGPCAHIYCLLIDVGGLYLWRKNFLVIAHISREMTRDQSGPKYLIAKFCVARPWAIPWLQTWPQRELGMLKQCVRERRGTFFPRRFSREVPKEKWKTCVSSFRRLMTNFGDFLINIINIFENFCQESSGLQFLPQEFPSIEMESFWTVCSDNGVTAWATQVKFLWLTIDFWP